MIASLKKLLLACLCGLLLQGGAGRGETSRGSLSEGALQPAGDADWPMAGANPERTSWSPEEVRGRLRPLWFKPFEPYISQKVQIVAAYDTLYIATARGLYALDAKTGAERWVYPTELPLGHSPTLHDGVAYVGGLDHRLHAVDALTGEGLWTFEAGAGFQTNPLVMDGRVYAGNRDGFFYAIEAQGARAGRLAWRYRTEGPILFSAAYKDGVVYFASQDSRAYALDARTGALVWRSAKLPGAGFHSWWPVVHGDRLILAGSHNYRSSAEFFSGTLQNDLDKLGVYSVRPAGPTTKATPAPGSSPKKNQGEVLPGGTWVGPLGQEPGDWAPGTVTLNTSLPNVTANGSTTPITEYLETYPWRRTVFVLDRHTGQEVTYDFDRDGRPEYAPFLWFGTHSGNRYPPVVGGDGVVYLSNGFQSDVSIPWGHITGWKMDTPFISLPAPDRNAVDEPQGYAAGGDLIYWNRCCDRIGSAFDIVRVLNKPWHYFNYDLHGLLPGYNSRYNNPDTSNYTAVYAAFGGPNGVYGFHGDTNAPIPYDGRVYMHRSNAVIAFGPSGGAPAALPMAQVVDAQRATPSPLGARGLKARLVEEIEVMLAAGHLRPGYASHGHFDSPAQRQCGDDLVDYWHHPGETIVTLTQALSHLPPGLQAEVKAYLRNELTAYPPYRYNHIGWRGAAREAFDLPPEVAAELADFPPEPETLGFVWRMNPYGLYALWQYARVMGGPELADELLAEARGSPALMASLSAVPEDSVLARMPFVHNAYIAGHLGYLGLESLAGKPESSPVRAELDRLMELRATRFTKDSAYAGAASRDDGAYCRTLNVAGNFMFMVPELADYLRLHARAKVEAAVTEYEAIAPYWFVSFSEDGFGENALNPLYDGQALFMAEALILREAPADLEQYLDVPGFARGDLFYIQKLVATLNAYRRQGPQERKVECSSLPSRGAGRPSRRC